MPQHSHSTPSEVDALQRLYSEQLPGAFLREVFRRWPGVVAEVRRLREELEASRGQAAAGDDGATAVDGEEV